MLLESSGQCPLFVAFVQGTGAEMAGDSGARAALGLWVVMLVGLQRIPGLGAVGWHPRVSVPQVVDSLWPTGVTQ